MDLIIHESQALSPIKCPSSSASIFHSSSHSSFPIIIVAIIGILATIFLLVFYYIFVIKCCLNWHRIDLLRRFSLSRNSIHHDPLMPHSPAVEKRGLEESVIRSIPIFQFKKEKNNEEFGARHFVECSVCLNEFQEKEKLRMIPNCAHVFHIDCIDVWLQNNPNCPLCRMSISISISISTTTHIPIFNQEAFSAINSPSQDNFPGNNEDYVVIELGEVNIEEDPSFLAEQEKEKAINTAEEVAKSKSISHFPRKLERKTVKKGIKLSHVTSMGNECISTRGNDDGRFSIQPIRRSFSMDSASDRQLYLAVQEITEKKNKEDVSEASSSEGCSSNRVRRGFFSFGSGRGSPRSAILPAHFEP